RIKGRTPAAEAAIAETVVIERVLDVADLAAVDAVAELNDHVRALSIGRGLEAARLELLGDDSGIALELEAAIVGHASCRHDIEGLALGSGHRLIARDGGVELLGAGGQAKRRGAKRQRSGELTDTHEYIPSSGQMRT